ncbi:MAG TPA: hypothetical protein VM492_11760, partial [Sumerlaeia bacterium]|nr:hypothetical protein [Sumerlaeia bacterium]
MAKSVAPLRSQLFEVLRKAWDDRASDVHLRADEAVVIRVDGVLRPLEDLAPTSDEIHAFLHPMLREDQKGRFQECRELDFACEIEGL